MAKTKKFINDSKLIAEDMISGYVSAARHYVKRLGKYHVLVSNELLKEKVGIIIGGGIAAEPLFLGYVGKNMADCAVIGNIDAAPSPDSILEGVRAVNQGKGILFVYNNYPGDVLCFDMAAEMALDEGIETYTVRVWDEVGSIPSERANERRGVAGALLVIKIAGGAASVLSDLEEVYRVAVSARDNTRTLIVTSKSGSYLGNGELMFDLPDDEIEYGVGFHGEPGYLRTKMLPSDKIVDLVIDKLVDDLNCKSGDEVAIMLNSMGSTSIAELFILNKRISERLPEKGIFLYNTDVGFYYNSQDMGGFSLSLLKLNPELKKYYDLPAASFSYRK